MYTDDWTSTEEITDEFSSWKNCYTGTFHRIQKRTKAEAKRAFIVFSSLSLGNDYRDIEPALRRHFIKLFMASGTENTLSKKAIKEGQKESKEIINYYTGFICDE
tara:strand:+ start:59 stop:373 length:315 start_codon:yes stop_codon:yes gene_type:complete